MEETLTIHKLVLIMIFSRSFGTTNCIESVNSQLRKYTGRVSDINILNIRYLTKYFKLFLRLKSLFIKCLLQ